MSVYPIDPLKDPRWRSFLSAHDDASVFHSPGWLSALQQTYAYDPIAFTCSGPTEEISNGMVFCEIRSVITGRRLVSLPFSDYCQPLVVRESQFNELLSHAVEDREKNHWRYIEVKLSLGGWMMPPEFHETEKYYIHRLELNLSLEQLFRRFHKDSVQRKILRAEKEALFLESGSSDTILDRFYSLMIQTRRRHGLPPQPKLWFHNLVKHLPGILKIHLASKDGRPLAGILTLHFKNVLVYKYGGSDSRFHRLGAMHALLWRAIQQAKSDGVSTFDLGRTDPDNPGLVTFKDRWGARRTALSHYRSPDSVMAVDVQGWKIRFAKQIFAHLPDRVLVTSGRLFYKHMG